MGARALVHHHVHIYMTNRAYQVCGQLISRSYGAAMYSGGCGMRDKGGLKQQRC